MDVERRVRAECNLHCGTPYPPAALLWQYPMSIWPLRAFSGLLDDRINSPAPPRGALGAHPAQRHP